MMLEIYDLLSQIVWIHYLRHILLDILTHRAYIANG